jgi:hypothetical protein
MSSDLILEILLVAGAAYAMFKAGMAYTIWRIQQDLIALENGEIEFEEESSEPSPNGEFMKIIKENGVFYAYGNNDRFLTQGKDLAELFKNIKDGFPGTIWLIGNDNKSLSREEQESIMPILEKVFEESKNEG